MTPTEQFIHDHRHDDVRQLALQAGRQTDVDLPYALDQIKGWQTACHKLPTWAATSGIVYPPHLNMEQCSSEATARYKAEVLLSVIGSQSSVTSSQSSVIGSQSSVIGSQSSAISAQSSVFIDLTGGFGVDFSFLSQLFGRAVYVERDEHLCALAHHNFECLGLKHATVVCADAVSYLRDLPPSAFRLPPSAFRVPPSAFRVPPSAFRVPHSAFIFLDPARRDVHGRKVAGMADCTPNVLLLARELQAKAAVVMVKLSPMLDWHEAVRQLQQAGAQVSELHIVSVRNECKELLVLLQPSDQPLRIVCVNDDQRFTYEPERHDTLQPSPPMTEAQLQQLDAQLRQTGAQRQPDAPCWLFVPNSSVMKAGCFDEIAHSYALQGLGTSSHLFVGQHDVADFPGRRFIVSAISSMNKKEQKTALAGITQANIATRNSPLSVADLRKRLRLKDGGNCYIFATTVAQRHILIIAHAAPAAPAPLM